MDKPTEQKPTPGATPAPNRMWTPGSGSTPTEPATNRPDTSRDVTQPRSGPAKADTGNAAKGDDDVMSEPPRKSS